MGWYFLSDSRINLVVILSNLRARQYFDDSLCFVMLPFFSQHHRLTFLEDNARPHTSIIFPDYLYVRRIFLDQLDRQVSLQKSTSLWTYEQVLQAVAGNHPLRRHLEESLVRNYAERYTQLHVSVLCRIIACIWTKQMGHTLLIFSMYAVIPHE